MSLPSAPGGPSYPSHDELVNGIREADQQAFELVFNAHYADLREFVNNYVDHGTSEEVVQELFLSLWQKRESWVSSKSARPYLFAAARNRALNAIRARSSATRAADRCASQGTIPGGQPSHTPAHELSAAEIQAAVRREIHALPETNRVAMILRWQYGMSHAKIAFILGITIKGVEAELSRGVRKLSAQLAWLRD